MIDQQNAILLQAEIERHGVRLPVRDDLRVENDADVRECDFADFINRLVRNAHIALHRSHPFFRSVKRDDRAFPAGPDHGGAQNMRARHHSLSPDTRHANVKALCHLSPP